MAGDYKSALEAAGAKVNNFWEFGSYQGEWVAEVQFEGQRGFVVGYYGSCSGCDAFEAEFEYQDDRKPDYQERLAKFGKGYLNDIRDIDNVIAEFAKQSRYDSDAEEAVAALTKRKVEMAS